MAIGQSRLHEMLRRGRLFSEAVVWFETFDPALRNKILDWIRDDQLRKRGVDGDGNVIGYYSYMTSLINPKKKFNTHYTLEDTGAFFRSMFVKVLRDRIEINADADKEDENLFEKYGTKIIKLTDENFEKLKAEVKDSYIKEARRLLFGN